MPSARNIVSQWLPRNCAPMVDFLENWMPVVPLWILDNILEQLVFPKLQREVRTFSCYRSGSSQSAKFCFIDNV